MDSLEKALRLLRPKEKGWVKDILLALQSGSVAYVDVKKLKGAHDIFRVKKGNLRIIYQIRKKRIFILKIARRKENTYRL